MSEDHGSGADESTSRGELQEGHASPEEEAVKAGHQPPGAVRIVQTVGEMHAPPIAPESKAPMVAPPKPEDAARSVRPVAESRETGSSDRD